MLPKIDIASLASPKEWFRLHARSLRKELHAARPDAGIHAAANFMRNIAPPPEQIIAVYYSVGTELDTWPLVEELLKQGFRISLPVVEQKNTSLTFRLYTPETELIKGTLNIPVPPEEADTVTPDIILCPLLAFKKDGTRLGMGGGYYDRTLSGLRKNKDILAVGYAYSRQETPQLPAEKHDEKLDWIVTERDAIRAV